MTKNAQITGLELELAATDQKEFFVINEKQSETPECEILPAMLKSKQYARSRQMSISPIKKQSVIGNSFVVAPGLNQDNKSVIAQVFADRRANKIRTDMTNIKTQNFYMNDPYNGNAGLNNLVARPSDFFTQSQSPIKQYRHSVICTPDKPANQLPEQSKFQRSSKRQGSLPAMKPINLTGLNTIRTSNLFQRNSISNFEPRLEMFDNSRFSSRLCKNEAIPNQEIRVNVTSLNAMPCSNADSKNINGNWKNSSIQDDNIIFQNQDIKEIEEDNSNVESDSTPEESNEYVVVLNIPDNRSKSGSQAQNMAEENKRQPKTNENEYICNNDILTPLELGKSIRDRVFYNFEKKRGFGSIDNGKVFTRINLASSYIKKRCNKSMQNLQSCKHISGDRIISDTINIHYNGIRKLQIEIPDEYVDYLTNDLISDAVDVSSGFSYERASVLGWIRENGLIDPKTGERLKAVKVFDNKLLNCKIEEWVYELHGNRYFDNASFMRKIGKWIDARGRDYLSKDERLSNILKEYDEAVLLVNNI